MSVKQRSKNLKIIQGRVVSDKMNKTRVLLVKVHKTHPIFKKSLLRSRKVKIHDEANEARVGDLVSALQTRPLSKDKRHRLLKILERVK